MNTPVKNVANAATAAKARKARKPASGKRLAAESAFKNAKSDQEKTVARSHLKAVRFEELGRARVRRALKTLSSLENLANRGVYTWTDEQANKLLTAIHEKVKQVTLKFAGTAAKKEEFDF
jgi:hypothetical protein